MKPPAFPGAVPPDRTARARSAGSRSRAGRAAGAPGRLPRRASSRWQAQPLEADAGDCDPAVRCLDDDVRPVDYSATLAAAVARLLFVEDGSELPPWWEAVRRSPAAEPPVADLATGLERLARAGPQ